MDAYRWPVPWQQNSSCKSQYRGHVLFAQHNLVKTLIWHAISFQELKADMLKVGCEGLL